MEELGPLLKLNAKNRALVSKELIEKALPFEPRAIEL